MSSKTNSMRLLEARRISYEAHEYSNEIRSAEEAADQLGVPRNQVYKTLVVLRERGRPLLVMLAGDKSLDLRLLAKDVGEKKLHMATHREAEELTGLEVGGISALCLLHRGFEICADEAISELSKVYVSAGVRGVNLALAAQDLIHVTGARLVRAAVPEATPPADD